jgi:Zinc-binding domain of primase-helicase
MQHELGDLAQRVKPGETDSKTFMLPSKLNFDALSYAATKALIACYMLTKYRRKPFRIVLTREALAEAAHLSVWHLRRALRELEGQRLVHVKQILSEGTQLSLLDPNGSGATLYDIAMFNIQRFDSIPAYQWFRLLLHDDSIPRGTRQEWRATESSYTLLECPFCGARKKFRITLILDKTQAKYEKDSWFCHACQRGGDTRRLWGLLHFYIDRQDWREALMHGINRAARTSGSTAVATVEAPTNERNNEHPF